MLKFFGITFAVLCALQGQAQDLSLSDFLASAWEQSPVKNGESYKNAENEERIDSAKGGYLPHLSIDAIDSSGFAASNGGLGVQGIMGSPFRTGFAGGVVLKQTVYDFGRIQSDLARAHAEKGVEEAKLADEKMKFLTMLGRLYLTCAQASSIHTLNENLLKTAEVVQRETSKFTKTGQRSIVDNELVRIEVDDLNLQQKQLEDLQKSVTEQMRMYSNKIISCQNLENAAKPVVAADLQVKPPQVLLAQAERQEIDALYSQSKSLQLPKLDVMGSLGEMDGTRLVTRYDYALGVGLVFPLWDGGEEYHHERSLKNRLSYQDDIVKTVFLEYEAWLKDLRDSQARNQEVLGLLDDHVDQVRKTVNLATKRFFQLQGNLVDVRDTLNRLRTLENQKIQTESAVAYSALELSLLAAQ